MINLGDKLLAAGVITQKDIARAKKQEEKLREKVKKEKLKEIGKQLPSQVTMREITAELVNEFNEDN